MIPILVALLLATPAAAQPSDPGIVRVDDLMKKGQLKRFEKLVTAAIKKHSPPLISIDIAEGVAWAGDPKSELGLLTLAQNCVQSPEGEWKNVVEVHFANMARSTQEREAVASLSWEQALPRLWVNPYAPMNLGGDGPVIVSLAGELDAVLMIDLPSSIASVTTSQLTDWGQTTDSALAAVKASMATRSMQATSIAESMSVPSWNISGPEFYGATPAVVLGSVLPPADTRHWLIAVPNRLGILAVPVGSLAVVEQLGLLINATLGMYQEGPRSISPYLYWWDGTTLTLLPSEVRDGKMYFAPPDAFVETVLEPLTGE